jgi:hypothetical protein
MENPFKQEYFKNIPDEKIEQVYRNPRLKLPFDPKDLVMFLDRKAEGTDAEKAKRLRTIPYHHRSADLGITTPIHERFPSKSGEPGMHHVYTQFDIKGGGFVYPEEHESKKHGLEKGGLAGADEVLFVGESKETEYGYDVLGLMDENSAMITKENAKDLAKSGMRTEAIAGIYSLEVISVNGEEVPVADLRKDAATILKKEIAEADERGDKNKYKTYKDKLDHLLRSDEIEKYEELWRGALADDDSKKASEYEERIHELRDLGYYNPAIEVRCMRSVLRLRDLKDAPKEYRSEMIKEAVKSLNIEMEYLGEERRFDAETPEGRKEWLEFVTYWIGKNLGILHSEGMSHSYLHMGNLTLAGEIIDLDSVNKILQTGKGVGDDFKDQDFYQQKDGRYVCLNPGLAALADNDERFGLPKILAKDMRDVCFSFKMMLKKIPELRREVDKEVLATKMVEGYIEGLGDSDPFAEIGVNKDVLMEVMEKIAQSVIFRNEPYPSYQKGIGAYKR